MLSGLMKFRKQVETLFFKMASVNTSNHKSLTAEEDIRVFADAAITYESETETSTSEEDDDSGAPP